MVIKQQWKTSHKHRNRMTIRHRKKKKKKQVACYSPRTCHLNIAPHCAYEFCVKHRVNMNIMKCVSLSTVYIRPLLALNRWHPFSSGQPHPLYLYITPIPTPFHRRAQCRPVSGSPPPTGRAKGPPLFDGQVWKSAPPPTTPPSMQDHDRTESEGFPAWWHYYSGEGGGKK